MKKLLTIRAGIIFLVILLLSDIVYMSHIY